MALRTSVFAPLVAPLLVPLAALALAGCAETVAGGAAATGIAAAQERTIGQAIDDAVIDANVNSAILSSDIELFRRVSIEVHQGRVLLTGAVPRPEDRIEAVRRAWQVDGVKEVLNEIQVDDTSGIIDYARDVWISTQLRTKLLFDRSIKAINYNIETVNGVVYLLGIAQDQGELDRVINHARTIPHVRQVVSHVRLKGATGV